MQWQHTCEHASLGFSAVDCDHWMPRWYEKGQNWKFHNFCLHRHVTWYIFLSGRPVEGWCRMKKNWQFREKILGKRRWLADKWGFGVCNNSDINVSLLTFEVNSGRKAKAKVWGINFPSLWISCWWRVGCKTDVRTSKGRRGAPTCAATSSSENWESLIKNSKKGSPSHIVESKT